MAEKGLCIFHTAQSNGLNDGNGEVGTEPAIRYYYYSHGAPAQKSSGGVFLDLVGRTVDTGGYDYTVGKKLRQAGVRNLAIVSLTDGSSFYNQWFPTHPNGIAILGQAATALAQLDTEFPLVASADWTFLHLRNQGTTDARQSNSQYQTGEPPGTYPGWSAGTDLFHNALQTEVSNAGFANSTIDKLCVMSFTGLTLQENFPNIQRQQYKWVAGSAAYAALDPWPALPGEHPDLIKGEDAAAYDNAGAHMSGTTDTIEGVVWSGGGYMWIGETRIAPAILRHLQRGSVFMQLQHRTSSGIHVY